MKQAIQKLIQRGSLTDVEAANVMKLIMDGAATSAQIAALAVALRMKGETVDEITGFTRVMRDYSIRVPVKTAKVVVDTCGTGGDSVKTFNISTAAALVAAACGKIAVAKHGNRAATSTCGSADVLEAAGVRIDIPPHEISRCIETVGIGFLYAPSMHPALKYAAAPRKEIGTRTFFNVLGPLTNPAGAKIQLIGVNDISLCDLLARVLQTLGSERVLMVHGVDGLDELSTLGETAVTELKNGEIKSWKLDATKDLGLCRADLSDLSAGDSPQANAALLLDVLYGVDKGARRDIVCLNAAGVLMVSGVVETLGAGLILTQDLIDSGAAAEKLEALRDFTNSF